MYDLLDRSPCELREEPRLVLMTLRLWVRAIKEKSCPLTSIEPILSRCSAAGALWPLHNYFYWTAAHATRQLRAGCCACGAVSEDEALIVTAVRSSSSLATVEGCLRSLIDPAAVDNAAHLAMKAQDELCRAFTAQSPDCA